MERVVIDSGSADETESVASTLAGGLEPGDVVLVWGDVGAGKTTFVRGACRALGVEDRVTSPSFTIGHLYEGDVPVAHVDLFRLETLAGEEPGLLADYLAPGAIAFIEWPSAAAPELDPDRVVMRVSLEHRGGDRRRIEAAGEPALVGRVRS